MPPLSETYFITITLPPRFYKKKAVDQTLIMKRALTSYSENFFDELEGIMELTAKCNIHFHGMVNFRESSAESAEVAKLKFLDAAKEFSRVDVQKIKDREHVRDYIQKDLINTQKVLGLPLRSIRFRFVRHEIEKDLCKLPENLNIL